jgi:hypothetical protein
MIDMFSDRRRVYFTLAVSVGAGIDARYTGYRTDDPQRRLAVVTLD